MGRKTNGVNDTKLDGLKIMEMSFMVSSPSQATQLRQADARQTPLTTTAALELLEA